MFLSLLRHNKMTALSGCFLLLFLLWIPSLFFAPDAAVSAARQQMAGQSLWLEFVPNAAWLTWCAFGLTFLSAFLLLHLNNRHLFHSPDEFLLPLLYVLTASAIPATQWFSGVQAASLFVFIGLNYLFRLHHRAPGLAELFIAAFSFSLSAICFPPAAPLLLLLPITLFVVHYNTWRHWLILFTAVLLPFAYVLFFGRFVAHDSMYGIDKLAPLLPSVPTEWPEADVPQLLFFGSIFLIVLLSLAGGFLQRTGTKAKDTYVHAVFGWMLLLLVGGVFFYPNYTYQSMPLIALPAAGIMAYYFVQPKGRKMKIFCWLILLAAILYLQTAKFIAV